jgi:non-specific serine/threonine protein kinase
LLDALVDSLSECRALLLILDNCEHLVDACARLIQSLLGQCAGLSILATSRTLLGLTGETVWRVPSLDTPPVPSVSLDEVMQFDAVRLFVDRASAALAGFALDPADAALVSRVCRRLDGLPLAIELAAPWIRVLSLGQLADRLDQRFELVTRGSRTALARHQTLQATIEWSVQLLDDPERSCFAQLGIFSGGWMLEAAEAVCAGGEFAPEDVLPLLARLVDASLVEMLPGASPRYRMLETLRSFARELLASRTDVEALCKRHAGYFLAFAEQAEPHLEMDDASRWLDMLEQEHDNLRAALEWHSARGEGECGQRMAGALRHFWNMRGYLTEGCAQLRRQLACATEARTGARAKALSALALLLEYSSDDPDEARALRAESLAIRLELGGDRRTLVDALLHRSAESLDRGHATEARPLIHEALTLARELRHGQGVAKACSLLGALTWLQGDVSASRGWSLQAAATYRELGDLEGVAWELMKLGESAVLTGDGAQAKAWLAESLALFRQIGYPRGMAYTVRCLASLVAEEGDSQQALVLVGAAAAVFEAIGATPLADMNPRTYEEFQQRLDEARARLGAEADAAWAKGRQMSILDAVALAVETAKRSA